MKTKTLNASEMGKLGAKARWAKMTPKQRKEWTIKINKARQDKLKTK